MEELSAHQWFMQCRTRVSRHFIGPENTVKHLCISLLAGLHVLLEDLPGTGKTTLAKAFAGACGLDLGRIQCTPDLLPGDILGMLVFDRAVQDFRFKPGVIMHGMVFADELNRCPTRTQAAFLEAMQESQISVEGQTLNLPDPFFMIATQNPQGFAGTFPLPEAQLDRFGMKLHLGYPDSTREAAILDLNLAAPDLGNPSDTTQDTMNEHPQTIRRLRNEAEKVMVHPAVRDFAVALLQKSRIHHHIRVGLAPRAGVHLLKAAKAKALIENRTFIVPDDLIALAGPVLAHRLVISSEARIAGLDASQVIGHLTDEVPKPLPLA